MGSAVRGGEPALSKGVSRLAGGPAMSPQVPALVGEVWNGGRAGYLAGRRGGDVPGLSPR
jgi:hypothetical protein